MANSSPRSAGLTVENILRQQELRLELVAGSAGVRREVTWVHIIEVEDPTPFLNGGELVLTTGLGVGPGPKAQTAYLQRLADRE